MLDVLHERRKKASKIEKIAWSKFWDKESQRLLLYACRHGTVEVVHYFLKHRLSPTTRLAHMLLTLGTHAQRGLQ